MDDDPADRTRALLGQPKPPDDVRAKWKLACEANRHGKVCGRCGKEWTEGETIYRQRMNLFKVAFINVCVDCKFERSNFYIARPCEHCARPIQDEVTARQPRFRVFCCDMCMSKQQSKLVHERKVAERGTRECPQCHEVFEPQRADSIFCSGACRQKNYRSRVTDRKVPQLEEHSSRNADDDVTPRKSVQRDRYRIRNAHRVIRAKVRNEYAAWQREQQQQ